MTIPRMIVAGLGIFAASCSSPEKQETHIVKTANNIVEIKNSGIEPNLWNAASFESNRYYNFENNTINYTSRSPAAAVFGVLGNIMVSKPIDSDNDIAKAARLINTNNKIKGAFLCDTTLKKVHSFIKTINGDTIDKQNVVRWKDSTHIIRYEHI